MRKWRSYDSQGYIQYQRFNGDYVKRIQKFSSSQALHERRENDCKRPFKEEKTTKITEEMKAAIEEVLYYMPLSKSNVLGTSGCNTESAISPHYV